MSAVMQRAASDHEVLGMIKETYREVSEALADQVAAGDATSSPHQREADLEEAEWMLGIFRAAGLTVTRAAA